MWNLVANKLTLGRIEIVLLGTFFGLIVVGSGAVAFADSAQPGDRLYLLDRAAESTQAAFTFDETKKAQLTIALMQERYDEFRSLIKDGADLSLIDDARDDFETALKKASHNMNYDTGSEEATPELVEFTKHSLMQQTTFKQMIPEVSEGTQQVLKRAKETSARGLKRAIDAVGVEEVRAIREEVDREHSSPQSQPPVEGQSEEAQTQQDQDQDQDQDQYQYLLGLLDITNKIDNPLQ